MTTAVQHRRGTTAEHSTFTGLEGEVTIDTTKDTAVIHDGVLAGGYPLAKETLANVNPTALTAITGAATASDDLFMVYDASTTSMKKITRAELNNAMEADALANVSITGGTINGTTIGGTTAAAGAFTTLSASDAVTLSAGTANGVAYLNGSKVLTSGSALKFDGTNLGLGVTPSAWANSKAFDIGAYGALSTDTLNDANTSLSWNAYATAYNAWKYKNTGSAASRYAQEAGKHYWYTAPSGTAGNAISFTQALSVGHGTSLALQGATSQTGTGITFPATQNASSDANTLDDYEEGTFTPTIAGTTSTGIGIYVTQIGKYTKVGNRVMFAIELVWTAHTGTGNMEIRGLPFTVGSMNIAAAIRPDNMTLSAGYYPISFIYSGSTIIQLAQTPTGTVNAALIPMDTSANVMVTSHYDIA